jgi:hypothetical protein
MTQQQETPERDALKLAPAGSEDAREARRTKLPNIEAILAANAAGLLHKAIEQAHAGNGSALRLTLQEALTQAQKRASEFELPASLETTEGIVKNSEAVIVAHGRGRLSFERAAGIQALLFTHQKLILTRDGKTPEQGDVSLIPSGSMEDFLEPLQAVHTAIGYKSKALEVLERGPAPASQE